MMISAPIKDLHPTLTNWRRQIHAHPETAFEEYRTADFVAQKLREFGLEVHTGLGKTGVVGTLKSGNSSKSIGLRADMDALFIQEENTFTHKSTINGKMHACGHDGHTAMLLGAAKYLAQTKNFNGTIHFIFQPAEETGDEYCGGNTMVTEGLFEKFPVECIFGMHNMPTLPFGSFSVRKGAMLASIDTFEFKILSQNIHPALQHQVPDPILTASRVIEAFHSFKARYINPAESVILTITQFKAGDPINDRQGVHVTPDEALVRGTVLTLNEQCRDILQEGLSKTIKGIALSAGADHQFQYERGYPVLINSSNETDFAVAAATSIVGADQVDGDMQPIMGAEDFAFMLQKKPGCYVFIGTGGDGPEGLPCQLHNPNYDFNDEIIPLGVQYWITLAESYFQAI